MYRVKIISKSHYKKSILKAVLEKDGQNEEKLSTNCTLMHFNAFLS